MITDLLICNTLGNLFQMVTLFSLFKYVCSSTSNHADGNSGIAQAQAKVDEVSPEILHTNEHGKCQVIC